MTLSFYRNANCVICVFDTTNPKGLDSVKKWLTETTRYVSSKQVSLILVGNKIDLTPVITFEQARVMLHYFLNLTLVLTFHFT